MKIDAPPLEQQQTIMVQFTMRRGFGALASVLISRKSASIQDLSLLDWSCGTGPGEQDVVVVEFNGRDLDKIRNGITSMILYMRQRGIRGAIGIKFLKSEN